MEIHNIEIIERFDKMSSNHDQDLKISFSFVSDNIWYTAYVEGQAFVKDKESNPYVMLRENYVVYRTGGCDVSLLSTGIDESDLLEVLIKHCT